MNGIEILALLKKVDEFVDYKTSQDKYLVDGEILENSWNIYCNDINVICSRLMTPTDEEIHPYIIRYSITEFMEWLEQTKYQNKKRGKK